jgi:hypothetical protein
LIGYFFQFKIWANKGLKLADLAFEISNACGSAGCSVCWQANQCFSQRSNLIFELDLEQDGQSITSKLPLNAYTFQLGATSAVSVFDDPIRVTL